MKKGKNNQGFTIIEVALVLGIAGLIFLMVFIALPAVQRNAADAQRKDDIATLLGAIKKYQTNNRGILPTNWSISPGGDLYGYLSSDFEDPDGRSYVLVEQSCGKSGNTLSVGASCDATVLAQLEDQEFPNGHTMYIVRGATCDGATVVKSANNRKVAVVYKLQGYGTHCNNT